MVWLSTPVFSVDAHIEIVTGAAVDERLQRGARRDGVIRISAVDVAEITEAARVERNSGVSERTLLLYVAQSPAIDYRPGADDVVGQGRGRVKRGPVQLVDREVGDLEKLAGIPEVVVR